jgi:uncharacterized membrane protein
MAARQLPLTRVLVSLPTGLWTFGFACDVIGLVDRENWIWPSVAFYALAAGTAAGLAAFLLQFASLRGVAGERPRAAARRQLIINGLIVFVFVLDIVVRLTDFVGIVMPVAFSAAGIILLALAPRLGGDPPLLRTATTRGSVG